MIDILKDLGKGVIGMIVAAFLPKQVFISIKEILIFSLKSVLKFWIVNVLIVLIFGVIYYNTNLVNILELKFFILILGLFILILSVGLNVTKLFNRLKKEDTLIVYGCYSSKEKQYLYLDLDAELVNERLIKECKQLKSKLFVFKSNTPGLDFIELPKFIPIILGYRLTIRFFEKFITTKKHISSLYFIRDISDQKIVTNLNYEQDYFKNGELIVILNNLLNKISNEKIDIKEIAVINLKLFLVVFGQSFLDYFIIQKDFESTKLIIEDTEWLLLDIKNQVDKNLPIEPKEFTEFYNVWSSYLDRYRANLLLEQDEIKGAIKYIISSVKLNPYYPYSNYETFKRNYSKRYGIELSFSIEETNNNFEKSDKNNFEEVRQKLFDSIESNDAEPNNTFIQKILLKNSKPDILTFLENELKQLENNNPAILLLKSEVLKYLSDGSEKIDAIYSGRIVETISMLEELNKIDNKFPIINAKIGALMLLKAIHEKNDTEMENAMIKWTEGMHFLNELGFKTK